MEQFSHFAVFPLRQCNFEIFVRLKRGKLGTVFRNRQCVPPCLFRFCGVQGSRPTRPRNRRHPALGCFFHRVIHLE